ncbi:MAG: aromatic ring-hydroxylating oxygenase subunit alpha [Candidatus Poseidoniaceae archaeon]
MSEVNIDADIRKAETLPSEFYTDEQHFSKQIERLSQSLQFVGHSSEFTFDLTPIPHLESILKQPLLRTNQESEKHLLSNVCTHRGMLLCQEKKNGKSIQCPYHGRTFHRNGELKHMPGFEGVENFPSPSDDLPSLNLKEWFGFEFTSLDPALRLETILKPIEQRMNWWLNDLDLEHDASRDRQWDIDANWILYVDNYLEGFHIPFVHPELNDALANDGYSTECFENAVLQVGMANEGDVCFEIPNDSIDAGKRIAAYYWWMYPNMMMNIYPWGVSMNIIIPKSVNKTTVLFKSYVRNPELLNKGAGALLDKVELQDQTVVEGCMRGLQSKLYHRGRYSATHEKGVHHFHMKLTQQTD